MDSYTCPTCGEKLERDLTRLYEHTDQHIVDAIKKQHPEWVAENGFCKRCMSHFRDAIRQSHEGGKPATVNITLAGSRRRIVQSAISALLAAFISFLLIRFHVPDYFHVLFFMAVAVSMLCLLQANKKICVVYGLQGMKDMENGEEIIRDEDVKRDVFVASLLIILFSFISAVIISMIHYLIVAS